MQRHSLVLVERVLNTAQIGKHDSAVEDSGWPSLQNFGLVVRSAIAPRIQTPQDRCRVAGGHNLTASSFKIQSISNARYCKVPLRSI
jgi:hypothetical protein